MGVGDNIKQLREAKGISQRQLAREAGVSQPLLCQIERGTKNPSLPVGLALAAALGVRVERLAGRGGEGWMGTNSPGRRAQKWNN